MNFNTDLDLRPIYCERQRRFASSPAAAQLLAAQLTGKIVRIHTWRAHNNSLTAGALLAANLRSVPE
jgi:hypothetical protein